jgi:hypothetical protein
MATMVERRLDEAGDPEESLHRGRLQAQGGGTEKSEPWTQKKPPGESEMLRKCDSLDRQLTPGEARDRAEPLQHLRTYIRGAAQYGGVSAPLKKSFLKRGSRDIRVDLEVIKGTACVPDGADGEQ